MRHSNYIYTDGLQTERLATRFLREEDYTTWIPFMTDSKCIQFIPYYGIDDPAERAKHIIEKQIGRYAEERYGLQLLLDKNTLGPIGMCGLLLQDVDGVNELEVGYHLLPNHWGKGYAIEAAQAFKNYGFENKQADSIISMIDVGNTRSQQVATRNGMTQEPEREWNDFQINIYRIFKEEWQKAPNDL